MSSIVKSFNGRAIRIDPNNQYVCLTDMAKAAGKRFNHWSELKSTAEYLEKFSTVAGIPVTDNHAGSGLIQVRQGIGIEQGTWAHPKIAIRFAQWCSVDFAIQVDFWIDELLSTGKVEIAPTQPAMLPSKLAVETAEDINKIDLLLSHKNPRLAQILIDCAMNNVIESGQKSLPEFPEDKWHSIVSIADKMGIKTNASTRVKLGNHAAKQGFDRVREERLCNGQLTEIWCYRDNDDVRSVISDWFNSGN